jgi:hypothetical protein
VVAALDGLNAASVGCGPSLTFLHRQLKFKSYAAPAIEIQELRCTGNTLVGN